MDGDSIRQKFATCNVLPKPLIRQCFAAHVAQDEFFATKTKAAPMASSYREKLAQNIAGRMAARPDVDSPSKLSRRAFWTDGRRKGKRISPRAIRYLLYPTDESPAPALDLVVSIAAALDCEPWELLVDSETTRRHILDRMMHGERLELGPGAPPAVPGVGRRVSSKRRRVGQR